MKFCLLFPFIVLFFEGRRTRRSCCRYAYVRMSSYDNECFNQPAYLPRCPFVSSIYPFAVCLSSCLSFSYPVTLYPGLWLVCSELCKSLEKILSWEIGYRIKEPLSVCLSVNNQKDRLKPDDYLILKEVRTKI